MAAGLCPQEKRSSLGSNGQQPLVKRMARLHLVLVIAAAPFAQGCDSSGWDDQHRVAYVATSVPVRSEPLGSGIVLARLREGTALAVGLCHLGWCRVASNDVTGFIEQAYLVDSLDWVRYDSVVWAGSPARTTERPPPGSTARCGDGSFSLRSERRDACFGHGGVAQWLLRADPVR